MSLRTLVKISRVTNLSDARYCAGMGVEWLGFSMDELSVEKFNELRGWVAGVQIVGETEQNDPAQVVGLMQQYQPDALQVSNTALVAALTGQGLPVVLKIDLAWRDADDLGRELRGVSGNQLMLLLENSDEFARLDATTRRTVDSLSMQHDVLLGFGLTEGNVREVLAELPQLKGIALRGSDELRPGYNEFGELMNLLERLETDD